MPAFLNIRELLNVLYREEKLLTEMFQKRKSVEYRMDYALDIVDGDERRIQFLLDHSVLHLNGTLLELDDVYLQFFEQILETNEEINTSYINENIELVRNNITYFFNDQNELRKHGYLRKIKSTLRKMGLITLRNVVDLKRNVDDTFKNEPNYKNKQAKLKNLDQKRKDIALLITQIDYLIGEGETTFFKSATDEEMEDILIELRKSLQKSTHNLIEIEKQIIEYLNKIDHQSEVLEQLRRVKYMKDQFVLESETDFKQQLYTMNPVAFEPNPSYALKLSLDELQSSDLAFELIRKIAQERAAGVKLKQPVAEVISDEYLETNIREVVEINLEEMKNNFVASSQDLFDFIQSYDFPRKVSFEERITLFCQLMSQYNQFFRSTNDVKQFENYELAMIYPG